MHFRDLQKCYDDGKRDFTGIDLYGANLAGVVLVGANLAGATFFSANLEGADLRDANLEGANLQSANLAGANLMGANLTAVNLRRANLIDAILDKAIVENTVFTGAIMPNSQIYSNLENAIASMGDRALSQEEIAKDLQKIQKPQPPTVEKLPRKPRQSWQELLQDIPKFPLTLFTSSYIGFGFLLAISSSPHNVQHLFYWLVLWLTASLWWVSFDYVWLIPAINAFIIFLNIEIPLVMLIFMGLTFGMSWIGGKFNRSLSAGKALKESLWVVAIAYSVVISFLAMQPILIGAIIFGTVGMTLPLQMDTECFPRQQIYKVTATSAALGLILGASLGFLIIN